MPAAAWPGIPREPDHRDRRRHQSPRRAQQRLRGHLLARSGKDAQKSSSNTNDLRGKILRIHPVDAAVNGKWYTNPAGKLFPEGTVKTRPEIYAMGARNPFRVSAHPATGWVFFGEVGPDANDPVANRGRQGHDELNVVATAGNYGWPYCNGNNFAYNSMDYKPTRPTGCPGRPSTAPSR